MDNIPEHGDDDPLPPASQTLRRRSSRSSLRSASSASSLSSFSSLSLSLHSPTYRSAPASPMAELTHWLAPRRSFDSLCSLASDSTGSLSLPPPSESGPPLTCSQDIAFGASRAEWSDSLERAASAATPGELGRVASWLFQQLEALQGGHVPVLEARLWSRYAPALGSTLGLLVAATADAEPARQALQAIERSGYALATFVGLGDVEGACELLDCLVGRQGPVQSGLAQAAATVASQRVHDATFVALLETLGERRRPERGGPGWAQVILLLDAWLDEALSRPLEPSRLAAAWSVLGVEARLHGELCAQVVVRRQQAYLRGQPALVGHGLRALQAALDECGESKGAEPWALAVQASAAALAAYHQLEVGLRGLCEGLAQLADHMLLPFAADAAHAEAAAALRGLLLRPLLARYARPALADGDEWLTFAGAFISSRAAAAERQRQLERRLAGLLEPLFELPENLVGLADSIRQLLSEPPAPSQPPEHGSAPHGEGLVERKAALLEVLCPSERRLAKPVHRAWLLVRLCATYQRFWPVDFAFLLQQGIARLLERHRFALPILWRQALLGASGRDARPHDWRLRESPLSLARGTNEHDVDGTRHAEHSIAWPRHPVGRKLERAFFGGLRCGDVLLALGAGSYGGPSGERAALGSHVAKEGAGALHELRLDKQHLTDALEHDAWQAAVNSLLACAGQELESWRRGPSALPFELADEAALECGDGVALCSLQRRDVGLAPVLDAWARVQAAAALPSCRGDTLPLATLQLLAGSLAIRYAALLTRWLDRRLLAAWLQVVERSATQVMAGDGDSWVYFVRRRLHSSELRALGRQHEVLALRRPYPARSA